MRFWVVPDQRWSSWKNYGNVFGLGSKTVVLCWTVREVQWRPLLRSCDQRWPGTRDWQCQKFGTTISKCDSAYDQRLLTDQWECSMKWRTDQSDTSAKPKHRVRSHHGSETSKKWCLGHEQRRNSCRVVAAEALFILQLLPPRSCLDDTRCWCFPGILTCVFACDSVAVIIVQSTYIKLGCRTHVY